MTKRRELTAEEKEIARKLKAIFESKKKELNLNQLSAAHAMGWKSQGTVFQYLNGRIPLNTDAKIRFAELLGVKVTDFDVNFDKKHHIYPVGQAISKEEALPATVVMGSDTEKQTDPIERRQNTIKVRDVSADYNGSSHDHKFVLKFEGDHTPPDAVISAINALLEIDLEKDAKRELEKEWKKLEKEKVKYKKLAAVLKTKEKYLEKEKDDLRSKRNKVFNNIVYAAMRQIDDNELPLDMKLKIVDKLKDAQKRDPLILPENNSLSSKNEKGDWFL